MSAPLDVLAVMDKACQRARRYAAGFNPSSERGAPYRAEAAALAEARAAVAELIEAARKHREAAAALFTKRTGVRRDWYAQECARLDACLARVSPQA